MKAVILDLKGLETFDLSGIEQQLEQLVSYEITPETLIDKRVAGFDIVITNKTPVTAELLAAHPEIKYICVMATGTNVVDKAAAAAHGVPVSNCVAYGVDSVVQHVWSMILALHTNLHNYHNDVVAGAWQGSEQFCFFNHPIAELKGKTLGIVGYGNLGQGVAAVAQAFGMDLLISERPGKQKAGEGRVLFEELVTQADVITLHCPLTNETENLIDLALLKRMKPTAFLINTARGGIVNEAALVAALQQGVIAGAATDVLTVEPPVSGNPLIDQSLPNLIVTPHIAWGSEEARKRVLQQTAENIAAFKSGELIRQV